MAPMAARFLSKNQVFFPGVMDQVSGPPWPKVVRKVTTLPISPAATSSLALTWALASRWF